MPLPFDPIDEAGRQWEARFGPEPVAAMHAVTSVMRAQQILLARLNALLAGHELTFARYEALMLLLYSRAGALPVGKMGDRLQVHRTSVSSLVEGLERLGMVTRAPHPSDRRTTLVTLTEAGRAAALAATEDLHRARFGTAPLDDEALSSLSRTLAGLRREADVDE